MFYPGGAALSKPSALLLIVSALLLLPGGVATPPDEGGVARVAGISDEFDGTSLDPMWSWHNPPHAYDVGATTAGHLHMAANRNTNFGSGSDSGTLLYQPVNGSYRIETKILSNPATNFEKSGIMIRQDANNWVALKYQEENGDRVELTVKLGGSASDHMVSVTASPIWLRLERDGSTFNSYYSTNGANWTFFRTDSAALNDSVSAGLIIASGGASTNYAADFDYIRFGPANRAPAILQPFTPVTVNEDERLALDVRAHIADPDGDELMFEVTGSANIKGSYIPATGELEVYGAPNWHGAEFISIKATDPYGAWAMAQLRVTVLSVEDAPYVKEPIKDVAMLQGGRDSSLNLSRSFLDNDTAWGDSLSYSVENNGSIWVDISGGGNVTLTCPTSFHGNITMTFIATDRTGLSASAPCVVRVAHVNQPPVVRNPPPPIIVAEDDSVTLDMSRVFWDPEGGPLALSCSGNQRVDVEILPESLNITFRPRPDASDFTEDFLITATDDGGLGASVGVSVTVTPVNDAPRISALSPTGNVTLLEGEAANFSVTASDPERGPVVGVSWYIDDQLVQMGAFSCTFVTNYTSAGTHVVAVAVDDGELVVWASWNVTVRNVNRGPMGAGITSPATGQVFKLGQPVRFQGSASDPDGDPLTFQWMEGLTELGRGPDFTTSGLSAGTHTIFLQVSDDSELARSGSVTITIRPNTTPRIISFVPADGQRFDRGRRMRFEVEAMDDEGDPLNFAWYEGPALLSNASFFIKDDLGPGLHTIRLVVSDGSAEAELMFRVEIVEPAAEGVSFVLVAIVCSVAAMAAVIAGFWLWSRRRAREEE